MGQGQSRFIAFLDECGDHSMEKIDSDFPFFVLAAVVVERTAYTEEIIPKINRFKLKYWDHEGVNLHSRDIRKKEGPFTFLQAEKRRDEFIGELNHLMETLSYTLFIIGIDKKKHKEKYGANARNPYALSLKFLFERIVHFLGRKKERDLPVIDEARGRNEDNELRADFFNIFQNGTEYTPPDSFKKLNCPLLFKDKRNNIVGIQLADLCAYPSARKMIKPEQPNRSFDIVKEHLHEDGRVYGWKIFP